FTTRAMSANIIVASTRHAADVYSNENSPLIYFLSIDGFWALDVCTMARYESGLFEYPRRASYVNASTNCPISLEFSPVFMM
ncbi:hypothetical protein PFISCL1PPCAC_26355, partial [Pristionchus fissidentatus]